MTDLLSNPHIRELFGESLVGVLEQTFADVKIAEEEIAAVRGTDEPDQNDPVWKSFPLLHAQVAFPSERVYRIHCREIIERVRAGEDTRPGTDAELLSALSAASLEAPPTNGAVCLQARLMLRHFPESADFLGADQDHYERLHGREADDLDADLRRKLRQDERRPS